MANLFNIIYVSGCPTDDTCRYYITPLLLILCVMILLAVWSMTHYAYRNQIQFLMSNNNKI